MKKAFTLLELIFVIVIIGVLSAVAIPKLGGLTANSKISAELATASTIQSAIDDVHSEWIMQEDGFTWGNNKDETDLNDDGYPKQLGDCEPAFNWILKSSSVTDAKWSCSDNGDGTFTYHGPASSTDSGISNNGSGKPDSNDYWEYNTTAGTFSLIEN
jgi:prepilin-type N-terminal cleavage/methylation domain-containing protein